MKLPYPKAPWQALFLLALVPFLANWTAVSGWLTVNPIYALSGIGADLAAGPLPGSTSLDPNAGTTTQALGRFAAAEWLSGRIPWWNPYSGVGLPLAAEGQNQALFLPFVLLLAFHNGPLLLLLALQEVTAFSTYALLRQVALSRTAAWIGGALFAVNGTFAWFGDGPMMPVAFAPMLLAGIEMEWRAVQGGPRVRRIHGWMVAAIAVAFSLYAGFPETAYLDGLLGGAWSLLRLVQCAPGRRLIFATRIAAGAITGLLLAAPFIVPFVHMLSASDLGMHVHDIGAVAAPPAALPALVMPHVLGPQSFGWDDPTGVLLWLWSFLGGYTSLPILLLAVVAVASPGIPSRGLRWLLAAWCVLMVGASFGVPGITQLVYRIPGLSQVQVYRYSPPSWQLAVIVLAAMAVNDWQCGLVRPKRVAVAFAMALGAGTAALGAASSSVSYLLASAVHYDRWLITSVAAAAVLTSTVSLLLVAKPGASRAVLLAAVVLVDGVTLFSVPRLAGFSKAGLDMTAVSYLKEHLGLQRFYTLGPLVPNYPAFFELASINSNYLPTPRIWAEHVRTALDALTDPNTFSGSFQWPGLPLADHLAEFSTRLPAYRDLAVRFVLMPAGRSLGPSLLRLPPGPATDPLALAPGESSQMTLPEDLITPGAVESVSVTIGTYGGAADGKLSIRICTVNGCRTGNSSLVSAADNKPLEMQLNAPLAIFKEQSLQLQITHEGGTSPVAIWHHPQAQGVAPIPELTLWQAPAIPVQRVFSNPGLTIYELADPAPYFETIGSPCRITPLGREAARTECEAPARLMRRELFFEGWGATVNGRSTPINPAEPIFQAVDLPVGNALIEFRYAPPYTAFSISAFLFGIALLAVDTVWCSLLPFVMRYKVTPSRRGATGRDRMQ